MQKKQKGGVKNSKNPFWAIEYYSVRDRRGERGWKSYCYPFLWIKCRYPRLSWLTPPEGPRLRLRAWNNSLCSGDNKEHQGNPDYRYCWIFLCPNIFKSYRHWSIPRGRYFGWSDPSPFIWSKKTGYWDTLGWVILERTTGVGGELLATIFVWCTYGFRTIHQQIQGYDSQVVLYWIHFVF